MNENALVHYQIIVSFYISGVDLDPDYVTQSIQLNPTHSHRQGDIMPHSKDGTIYKTGHWSIKSDNEKTDNLSDFILNILDKLKNKVDIVKEFSKQYEVRFYCSIWGYAGLSLDAGILERIAQLGARLDVEFYVG